MLPRQSLKYNDVPQSFNSRDKESEVTARAAQTVISCPSCLTSFIVESTLISATSNPKFHCSRCDKVFGLSESAEHNPSRTAERQQAVQPQQVSVDVVTSQTPPPRLESPRPTASLRSSVKASDFSIGSKNESDWAGTGVKAAHTSQEEPSRAGSISKSKRPGMSLVDSEADTSERDDHSALTTNQKKLFSGGFDLSLPLTSPEPTPPSLTKPQIELPGPHPASHELVAEEAIDDESYTQALIAQETLPQRAWRKISLRNRSLLVATTPLIATLALLLSLSPLARVSPHSLGALLEHLTPTFFASRSPQPPPTSLAVKQLSLKFVTTQTNEKIAVVTGTLVNTSQKKATGVSLEALVFNKRGEVVGTSVAPLRSALAKEKLSELPLETVKKFQSSLNARSASIAPGEAVSFTIALLRPPTAAEQESYEDLDLNDIKFFSARVFSVH